MRRRILSALLALCMASTLLVPVSAAPAETTTEKSAPVRIEVEIQQPEPIVIEGLGSIYDVVDPALVPSIYNVNGTAFDGSYRNQLDEVSQKVYDAILASELGTTGPKEMTVEIDVTDMIKTDRTFDAEAELTVTFDGSNYNLSRKITKSEGLNNFVMENVAPAQLALLYDHPELSWLVNTGCGFNGTISGGTWPEYTDTQLDAIIKDSGGKTNDSGTVTVKALTYTMDLSAYANATQAPATPLTKAEADKANTGNKSDITNKIDSAKSAIGNKETRYEQVKAIHDWLCNNVKYAEDTTSANSKFVLGWRGYQTAYSALVEKETVCAGYAKSFKLLCDEYDIPCIVVTGTGGDKNNTPQAHAWNYVQMDDEKWYAVDCTWDDQTENDDPDLAKVYYDYFLVGGNTNSSAGFGGNTFNNTHTPSGQWSSSVAYEFQYPDLSDEKYTVKTTPNVAKAPTATATYGQTLNEAIFNTTGASVVDSTDNTTAVEGTWSWMDTSLSVGNAGTNKFKAKFTPKNTTAYGVVENVDVSVTVNAKPLADNWIVAIPDQPYTGSAIEPAVTVKDGDKVLTRGTDYTVSYSGNTAVGTATVTVTGKGNYTGDKTAKFQITAKSGSITIADPGTITYDGTAVTVGSSSTDLTYTYNGDGTVTVKWYKGSETLVSAPKDAGTYEIGVSAAAGTNTAAVAEVKKSFTISPASYSYNYGKTTDAATAGAAYPTGGSVSGNGVNSETVSGTLVWYTDSGCTTAATGTFPNEEGSVTLYWKFTPSNSNYVSTPKTGSVVYTVSNLPGQGIAFSSPTTTASYGDAKIKNNTATKTATDGGAITYSSSNISVATVDATTGEVTIVGVGETKITATADAVEGKYRSDSAEYTLTVSPKALTDLTIDPIDDQPYTGKESKPEVNVTSASVPGLTTNDYDVAYSNNINVGTATVTVTAKGNYSGSATQTFQIVKGTHDALADIKISHRYNATGTGEYDLSKLVDGATEYSVGVITGDTGIISNVTVTNGKLTYTRNAQTTYEEGKKATFVVTIESANWANIDVNVIIMLSNKENQAALTVTSTSVTFPNTLALTTSGGSGNGAVTYTVADGTGKATITDGVLTPTKAGTVTVTATKAGDSDYEAIASAPVTVTIAKGTPTVVPTYTAITASGKTLADAALGVGATGTVPPGTIAWDAPTTTAVSANTSYRWTFTPTDTDNWNTATGSIVLWNYTPPTRPSGSSDSSDSSSSSSSGSSDTVSTSTSRPDGDRVTATTAAPSATTSNGVAYVSVSDSLGQRIVSQAVRNGSDVVIINPKTDRTAKDTEVTISAKTVQDIGSRTGADLKVNSPAADITIPNGALASLASNGDLTVSASNRDGVVSVEITADGRPVAQVAGGITAEIAASRCTNGTVAMLVAADGSTTVIRKSISNPAQGTVSVPLDGSAKLVVVDNSKDFADVPANNWAAGAISFISSREIMNGTDDISFSPSSSMTRGMLAAVLHNIEGNPRTSGFVSFSDVSSSWYEEAVRWAAGQGIVSGYIDGRFGPNDIVTREQLAVMLYRYAGQPAVSAGTLSFADANQVSSWAEDAIQWAVGAGILSGDGSHLNPGGQATRAETASMLMRFMTGLN